MPSDIHEPQINYSVNSTGVTLKGMPGTSQNHGENQSHSGRERYQIERALSEQPAGRFFVAIDKELGARVTAFYPNISSDTSRFLKAIQRELRRCAPLQGTPYCTLRDVGVTSRGKPYVVVDRPQGSPLSAFLREKNQLSIDDALSVAIQLCDLVHSAHLLNIFPVPVSPENIVLNPQPNGRIRVSLVDLGLQRAAYGDMIANLIRASHFQAPQMRSQQRPDLRDDVFAVTAVLHAMVFGVAPPAMSAHGPADGTGWPALPSDGRVLDRRLESCLQTVLLKGLAPTREERFSQIMALQRALLGLRQLMNLSAPAFELLAATRGRQGRRADAFDVSVPSNPGRQRAHEAGRRIQAVLESNMGQAANLTALKDSANSQLS